MGPINKNPRRDTTDADFDGTDPDGRRIDVLEPAEDAVSDPRASTPGRSDDVAEIRRERDEYYDRLLRKTAEFDNYRKRVERERRELAEFAAVDLLQELLPLLDDFERALQAEAGSESEPYRKGIEIIYRQLLEILRRRGVRPIEALGADFDPHVHQAVEQVASPDHREGEVIEELRRGYMLRDRLLRPALVKVAKA